MQERAPPGSAEGVSGRQQRGRQGVRAGAAAGFRPRDSRSPLGHMQVDQVVAVGGRLAVALDQGRPRRPQQAVGRPRHGPSGQPPGSVGSSGRSPHRSGRGCRCAGIGHEAGRCGGGVIGFAFALRRQNRQESQSFPRCGLLWWSGSLPTRRPGVELQTHEDLLRCRERSRRRPRQSAPSRSR